MDLRPSTVCSAFFLILFASIVVHAQATATPSTFAWENYKGTSQWSVTVTEDETACGAVSPSTTTLSATLQHDLTRVSTNDLPHSPWVGTMSGNTLSVPARTVDDPPGSSRISAVTIAFTPDCMGFSGRYTWNYADDYQSCSGTTSFTATRTDGSSCPGPAAIAPATPPAGPGPEHIKSELDDANNDLQTVRDLYKDAHSFSESVGDPNDEYGQARYNQDKNKIDALEPQLEQKYQDILKSDPNNFWANWDLAQLRKTQGDNRGYYDYIGKAVDGDPQFYERTRVAMKAQALSDLHWDTAPDPQTSPLVGKLDHEITGWSSGSIGDIMVTRPPGDTRGFVAKVLDTFSKVWSDGIFGVGGFKTTPSQ